MDLTHDVRTGRLKLKKMIYLSNVSTKVESRRLCSVRTTTQSWQLLAEATGLVTITSTWRHRRVILRVDVARLLTQKLGARGQEARSKVKKRGSPLRVAAPGDQVLHLGIISHSPRKETAGCD